MKLLQSTLAMAMIGSLTLGSAQQSPTTTPEGSQDVALLTQPEVAPVQMPTVVGVASSNADFSTLVAAIKAAGLVSTLNGDGPFTVFAPTNAAFGKLPAGTVESLLEPANKKTLTGILTYHVLSGKFMAADVVKAIQTNNNSFTVETVHGTPLTLSLEGDSVVLTDAKGNKSKVSATDVNASNGVIHVIDTVVMPE